MTNLVDTVAQALLARTHDVSAEARLHETIALALSDAGLVHSREAVLDAQSRIDFLVGEVGIEVKVKGSAYDILRQLGRYSEHKQIAGLVLATSRARHVQEIGAALRLSKLRVPCSVVLLRGAL